jgi:ribosomal protein S3
MGQKSSPVGLRLQINRTWDSRWFAEGQDYGRLLLEDLTPSSSLRASPTSSSVASPSAAR